MPPRKERKEFCLLCSPGPCECFSKPKGTQKKAAKKTAGNQQSTQQLPVQGQIPTPRKRAGLSAVSSLRKSSEEIEDEAELRRAVTLLVQSGIVAESSISEHRNLIDLTDAQIRAIIWRQSIGKDK